MHPGLGWALAPNLAFAPRTGGVFFHETVDTHRSVLESRSTTRAGPGGDSSASAVGVELIRASVVRWRCAEVRQHAAGPA
jgi:hypothetical protein